MKPSEADKIIAEFMKDHWPDSHMRGIIDYSQSLDALVPVWEKLSGKDFYDNVRLKICSKFPSAQIIIGEEFKSAIEIQDSIQQAAAIATAKAIQELDE